MQQEAGVLYQPNCNVLVVPVAAGLHWWFLWLPTFLHRHSECAKLEKVLYHESFANSQTLEIKLHTMSCKMGVKLR